MVLRVPPRKVNVIRQAVFGEAEQLSALAIRSKAVWDYDEPAMAVFRTELTMSDEQLQAAHAHVLEVHGEVVGFYTLAALTAAVIELQHLFIEPAHIRRGYGLALWEHAVDHARELGAERLQIIADPQAQGFYERLGSIPIGEHLSSIPSRVIPILEYSLPPDSRALD